MHDLKRIAGHILKAKTIAISGHVNPDGDSIGSLLALGLGLQGIGKHVYMLCQDEVPENYRFLPGASRMMKTLDEKVDLAIAVDCGDINLLGKNIDVFRRAGSVLVIDHHEFRKHFGDEEFIDHKAAAVGEQVYKMLKELNIKITSDIGKDLFTSIIVETNLFKLSNVTPFTFKLCAELLETGIDYSWLVDKVYEQKTKEALKLLAACFSKLKFLKNGKVVWSVLRKWDFTRAGGKDYDADAIANEMRSIKGVKVVVLFREKDKKTLRVSLRSRGYINVGKVAQQYNGGGHFDIAGCYIPNTGRAMQEVLSSAQTLVS